MYTYRHFDIRPDKNFRIGDCVIRATATAAHISYQQSLRLFGKAEDYKKAHDQNNPDLFKGVEFMDYHKCIAKLPNKPKYVRAKQNNHIYSLDVWAEATKKDPDKFFIFGVRAPSGFQHAVACKNGVIYECWNEQTFRYFKWKVLDVVVFQDA